MIRSGHAPVNEAAEMNEGIRFSDRKIQQKIYNKYKEIANVPPKYPAKAYTADTFKMWYEYMLDKGIIKDDFLNESNEMNEASGRHPKLGKKVKQLKGWKIYQGTDSQGDEIFRCFTPDDDYPAVGYEDWECETLEQAIEWIKNY